METVGTKKLNFPSRKIFNAKMTMKDSGNVVIFLRAPLIEEYEFAQTPYTLFRKGLNLDFYQKGKKNPGHLRANYAKIIEQKGWYEARNNIVIINSDGDTLKTNLLFWDKSKQKIFTNDTVRIYRADGATTNISTEGFESDENFKNFKLKKNHGTLPLQNDVIVK